VAEAKEVGAVGVREPQGPILQQEISHEDPSTENCMTHPIPQSQTERMYNVFEPPTFTRFGRLEGQMGPAEEDSVSRVLVGDTCQMNIKYMPQLTLLRPVLTPQFNSAVLNGVRLPAKDND